MRAAILSINLGEYHIFWKKFFESAEKNFLPDCGKEYFVFTDAQKLAYSDLEKVHVIHHEDMGWPYNTMRRFHLFHGIAEQLQDFDFIFFANANAEFRYRLTSDFILKDKNIVTVEHPGRHGDDPKTIPWERRKESRAYVSYEDSRVYVQGAFLGGRKETVLEMFQTLDELTEADLNDGIIAVVHDESFLNMYIIGRNDVQILGWQYLYFEEFIYPYVPVIFLRGKRRYLSKGNGRYLGQNRHWEEFLQFLRNVKWWILIKFRIYRWYDVVDREGKYVDLDISYRMKNR